ncbi:HlyD family secretion protein [Microbulbifer agarilyticus]|uniref:HlyD family secretion protein n=1 Tax=Microbulbifer agarilyticus TaxID=260552 RepID=UPI001CD62913|nr:HlyD family efflux transporter periplasmic adaptor subunit [Microbulbifer agarilyticus]MCA0892189.1 HlyD family efflux transporter periplasmic adaptor subunit [Microbulbifer agarilyticus]
MKSFPFLRCGVMSMLLIPLLLPACSDPQRATTKDASRPGLSITGELEAENHVKIAPPSISRMWNYSIKQLVPENTHVKKGDLIVAFDDKPVRDRLIEKKSELAQARSELKNTVRKVEQTAKDDVLTIEEKRAEFDKAERRAAIIDQSLSKNERMKSAIDFEIATNDLALVRELADLHKKSGKLEVSLAERKVDTLSAEVDLLQKQVDRLKVHAPIGGLVQYIPNWQGEKPSQGESVRFGQPVVLLSDLSRMQLRAQADEVDRSSLALGAPVDVVVDSAQGKTLTGKIAELGRVVRDRSNNDRRRVIDLLVAIDSSEELSLKPGMTATLNLAGVTRELSAEMGGNE